MEAEFALGMQFVEANAEETGLPDASFDLALSEYGASIWCDPYKWIPEAARLLRPGGLLVFLRNSTLAVLCATADDGPVGDAAASAARPAPDRLDRAGRDRVPARPRRLDQPAARERLRDRASSHELYAPESAIDHDYYHSNAEWSKKWPSEEIWRARLRRPLILASTSPQRRAILEQLRIPFDVVAPDYEEEPGVDPVEHARAKARSVAAAAGDRPVLGVDTEVLCDGRLFGKPRDEADAAEMLNALVGPHARGRVGAVPA